MHVCRFAIKLTNILKMEQLRNVNLKNVGFPMTIDARECSVDGPGDSPHVLD